MPSLASQKETSGVCMMGTDYSSFQHYLGTSWAKLRVDEHVEKNPGPIMDHQGKVKGTHKGLAYYTLGQRCRLGGETHKQVLALHSCLDGMCLGNVLLPTPCSSFHPSILISIRPIAL